MTLRFDDWEAAGGVWGVTGGGGGGGRGGVASGLGSSVI